MPTPPQPSRQPHVELILQHIDALPTLSPIATRVLEMTGSAETELHELVALVESDPTLSAKLLAMCRRSDRGAGRVTTVERAVVMLGFEAVRAALLSVEVFELLDDPADTTDRGGAPPFERRDLWLYAVGVGCAAELIAERHQTTAERARPDEAFVCGLLHDLGRIALDRIVPKTFAR
ncbi:MAG: HDOD domain-containing protein, partial [Planctomycetota bacterium]